MRPAQVRFARATTSIPALFRLNERWVAFAVTVVAGRRLRLDILEARDADPTTPREVVDAPAHAHDVHSIKAGFALLELFDASGDDAFLRAACSYVKRYG